VVSNFLIISLNRDRIMVRKVR